MADGPQVQLYQIRARCPVCDAPVRLRMTDTAVSLVKLALRMGYAEDMVIQTYQCSRKDRWGHHCNEIFQIRLGDWSVGGD